MPMMSSTNSDTAVVAPPAPMPLQEKTPRELVLLKKQAKAAEEESHYTYKPKVTKPSEPGVPNPGTSVFTKLYESKKKLSAVEVAATDVPQAENAAGAPKVKITAESINRLYGGVGAGKLRPSDAAAAKSSSSPVAPPSKPASAPVSRIASGKEKEKEKPPQGPHAPPAKKAVTAAEAEAASSRLYSEAEKIRQKIEERKHELEKEFSSKNTFKPTLLEKRKSKDATVETAGVESSEGCAGDVAERMKQYSAEKSRRLEEAMKARREQEQAQNTFKPTLVARPKDKSSPQPPSATAGNESKTAAEETAVFERLAAVKPKSAVRTARELTFQPQLATKKPATNASATSTEATPVFTRLSTTPVRASKDEAKESALLVECTFQPKVTELAASIHHDAQVHDRLNAETEVLRLEAEKREAQRLAEELKGATFSPAISEASKQLALKRQGARGAVASSAADGDIAGAASQAQKSTASPGARSAAKKAPLPSTASPTATKVGSAATRSRTSAAGIPAASKSAANSARGSATVRSMADFTTSSAPVAASESSASVSPSGVEAVEEQAGIVSMEAMLAGSAGLHILGTKLKLMTPIPTPMAALTAVPTFPACVDAPPTPTTAGDDADASPAPPAAPVDDDAQY